MNSSISSSDRPSKHLRYVAVAVAPAALMIAVCVVFLFRYGELATLPVIVRAQEAHGGLYGTAVHADNGEYKLELVRHRKPDIVIVGSSRVLTYRQELFAQRFTNMGLAASSAEQMQAAVTAMLRVHRPSIVVLGVDHYWGNPAYAEQLIDRSAGTTRRIVPNLLLPAQWLIDGKISAGDFTGGVVGARLAVSGSGAGWGVAAIQHGDGFAPDGSYVYGATIFGRRPALDPRFGDILSRVAHGNAQFVYGHEVSRSAVKAVTQSVAMLRAASVKVAVLIPPVAAPVYRKIRARFDGDYAYITPFLAELRNLGVPYYDMLDPGSFDGDDCEFIDGFHVGEVGAARIVNTMSGFWSERDLSSGAIAVAMSERAGHATLDGRFAAPGEKEVDFLKLGCPK